MVSSYNMDRRIPTTSLEVSEVTDWKTISKDLRIKRSHGHVMPHGTETTESNPYLDPRLPAHFMNESVMLLVCLVIA